MLQTKKYGSSCSNALAWSAAASLAFLLAVAGCGSNGRYTDTGHYVPPSGYEQTDNTAGAGAEARVQPSGGNAVRQAGEIGPLQLTDVTLVEGLRTIRKVAGGGPPIVVEPAAAKAVEGKRVSCELRGRMSLEDAIARFLAAFGAGLGYTYRDEAIVVGPADTVEPMVTMSYPVQRLLTGNPNFKAPSLKLDRSKLFQEPNETGSGSSEPGIEEGADDENKGKNDFRSPDDLINLIKSVIAPGTWGEAGEAGKGTVSVTRGILIVRHTVKVQQQVASLLAQLGN
jgi:hypothetical protein